MVSWCVGFIATTDLVVIAGVCGHDEVCSRISKWRHFHIWRWRFVRTIIWCDRFRTSTTSINIPTHYPHFRIWTHILTHSHTSIFLSSTTILSKTPSIHLVALCYLLYVVAVAVAPITHHFPIISVTVILQWYVPCPSMPSPSSSLGSLITIWITTLFLLGSKDSDNAIITCLIMWD